MFAHMPIIRDIIYGAVSRGVDFQAICKQAGIDPFELNDSEKRLDFESSIRVWEQAVKLTGDKMLGLHLGESANPTILGLIGHLMQSSETLQESFFKVCQFGSVATDMFKYGVSRKNSNYILSFKPADLWLQESPESARQAVEQAMAGTIHVFYLLAGIRIMPTRASFSYRRAGPMQEYERVFNCAIEFNAGENHLIFECHNLDKPVLSYDRSVFQLLDGMLQEKKDAIKKNEKIHDLLQRTILSEFKGQVPSIEIMASHLNLTARTLQRKLKKEKNSYRELTNSIKKKLARQWLNKTETKISQVSALLGYSEPSAFRRAFKKWNAKP